MNKALTIIMFSDDDHDTTVVDTMLYSANLSLAGKGGGPRTREQLMQTISLNKITPDIIIIDTYLGRNHADGSNLAEKLKPICPNAKFLAYTTLPEEQEWAQFTATKGTQDLDKSLLSGLKQLGQLSFQLDNSAEASKSA